LLIKETAILFISDDCWLRPETNKVDRAHCDVVWMALLTASRYLTASPASIFLGVVCNTGPGCGRVPGPDVDAA
jgi:hypothetical protein